MPEDIDASMQLSTFDRLLATLNGGEEKAPKGIDPTMAMIISLMQSNAQQQAAAAQRQAEQAQQQSQQQMQLMLGILAPLMAKPAVDPAMLALLTKNDNADAFKSIMELQRQQALQSQESLKDSLLSVMKTKDDLNERILEKALEANGDGGDESMGQTIMKALVPALLAPQPQQTAQPAALPPPGAAASAANPPGAQPPRSRASSPVIVVMRNLMALQRGVAAKPYAVAAGIVTVAVQDDDLVAALRSEDMAAILAYVAPRISAEAEIMEWLGEPHVEEWLTNYVDTRLIPQVLAIVDPDGGDDEEADEEAEDAADDSEPEAVTVTPAPAATIKKAPAAAGAGK